MSSSTDDINLPEHKGSGSGGNEGAAFDEENPAPSASSSSQFLSPGAADVSGYPAKPQPQKQPVPAGGLSMDVLPVDDVAQPLHRWGNGTMGTYSALPTRASEVCAKGAGGMRENVDVAEQLVTEEGMRLHAQDQLSIVTQKHLSDALSVAGERVLSEVRCISVEAEYPLHGPRNPHLLSSEGQPPVNDATQNAVAVITDQRLYLYKASKWFTTMVSVKDAGPDFNLTTLVTGGPNLRHGPLRVEHEALQSSFHTSIPATNITGVSVEAAHRAVQPSTVWRTRARWPLLLIALGVLLFVVGLSQIGKDGDVVGALFGAGVIIGGVGLYLYKRVGLFHTRVDPRDEPASHQTIRIGGLDPLNNAHCVLTLNLERNAPPGNVLAFVEAVHGFVHHD